jgi:hypothetical protein
MQMNLDKQQKTRLAIALGAVVALVLGFSVLNKSDSGSTANANTAMRGPGGQSGQAPPGAPGSSSATGATGATGGGMGQGGPPGGGRGGPGQMEAVTGTAATKAKAAAEAKVDGTAQQVMKNPQGSGYVVFVQTDNGTPTIVEVSTAFKVTATREMQGPPGGGRGGPPQGTNTQ